MFKIGLIDHYLDEWHANNYPQMLRDEIAKTGRSMEVVYAYANCDKPEGITTDEWCARQKCSRLGSIEEITGKCDALIVLAPSFPEMHEEMARIPLSSGKPVYIDKVFAPDRKTGERIFNHAAKNGTPLFSSSALRFSGAMDDFRIKKVMKAVRCLTGGAGSFEVYAIHQIEMIQAVMVDLPKRVKALFNAGGNTLIFDFGDGRMAQTTQMNALPFTICCSDGAKCIYKNCGNDHFINLVAAMVRFFEDRTPPILPADTLNALQMLTAAGLAMKNADTWVNV